MLPKRFDQARPFITLGAVLLVWGLLPVALKSFLRVSFFEMQAPFVATQSYAESLQEYWQLRLHSETELIEAGRDLARLNASYELRLQENEQLKAEILRLENLLKLPSQPDYRLEPARVARRDFSGWWQRLVIRKGRNYGITVGAPVVYVGGVVGRVSEVYAYTAVVDLITNPGVRLAASIEGDSRPISYQGGINESFRPPKGSVEFVPLDIVASTSNPRELVTSSLGGVFPEGLRIGEVTSLELGSDGLFKTGEVQLDSRLSELTEVTVLIPLNPEKL